MKQAPSFNYATIDSNGIAPDNRVPTANDAFNIADQLRRDNAEREHRWGAIYKCYKRFPPTDYSQLAKKQLFGMSNVPFGQMTFEIDDKKSAFIDSITDRGTAAKIITKLGNSKEKKEWSELISLAWDRALWEWDSYFYNIDQDLEEMLLFGKGIEIRDEKACWTTRSYKNNQVLIPDNTRASLDNLGEFAVREEYTPLEFWRKFKDSKDSKDSGWNFWACLEALRYYTNFRDYKQTNTQYLEKIASGNVNFNQYYNVKIQVYVLFVMEWSGKITKSVVLQNYNPVATARGVEDPKKYIDKVGYLYNKSSYFDKWDDVIWSFHGAAGSGLWHEIKGHGEDIFPAARQYDITMNKVIDGVNLEMMVPIKGGSADMTKKLRQMEWGRMFVLPEDVDFAQRQFQLPIADAINATTSIMQDTYRGMSSFNAIKPRRNQTLGEAELQFQEEAKLDGTQLRRFNLCQTRWQKGMFRKFVECKSGWKDSEIFDSFRSFLKDKGVPDEAWHWKNIELMTSNMLAGAGSPANKAIAGMKIIELAGMTAMNDGQENAIRDTLASLGGRDNVESYRASKKADIPDEARVIAFENGILNNSEANPENAIVLPTDNHVEHIKGHYSDAMTMTDRVMQGIQSGTYEADDVKEAVGALMLKGAHIVAHLKFLSSDQTKAEIVKQFGQAMDQLKKRTDQIISISQEMEKSKPQQQEMSPEEKQLQLKLAEKSIDLDAKQKANDLKLATAAQRHQQRMEIDKEKAATSIAIERAKAKQPIRTKKPASGGDQPE